MEEFEVYGMRVDRFLAEMPESKTGRKTIWKTESEKENNRKRMEETEIGRAHV